MDFSKKSHRNMLNSGSKRLLREISEAARIAGIIVRVRIKVEYERRRLTQPQECPSHQYLVNGALKFFKLRAWVRRGRRGRDWIQRHGHQPQAVRDLCRGGDRCRRCDTNSSRTNRGRGFRRFLFRAILLQVRGGATLKTLAAGTILVPLFASELRLLRAAVGRAGGDLSTRTRARGGRLRRAGAWRLRASRRPLNGRTVRSAPPKPPTHRDWKPRGRSRQGSTSNGIARRRRAKIELRGPAR
ncbi:hypothetical protein OF83DRAFT_571264 [Amylostereum chailletii]|nr:hypothetical protein OF83DRAFT_571264 [Amylostereum chailletii]